MLSHKIAIELAEAGFPKEYFEVCGGNRIHVLYIPTLAQLVDACGVDKGDEVFTLSFNFGGTKLWTAALETYAKGEGDCPEDAVARLWLALNKEGGEGDDK